MPRQGRGREVGRKGSAWLPRWRMPTVCVVGGRREASAGITAHCRYLVMIRTAGDRWMLAFPRVGRCPTSARRRRKEREPPLWQKILWGGGCTGRVGFE